MWQNCHDMDEIPKASISNTQYRPTQGDDGIDQAMPFQYPTGTLAQGPTNCSSTTAACATCVNAADTWCGSNAWDATCINFCTASCSGPCGGDSARTGRSTGEVISTFDTTTMTPRDFHSIHDL